MLAPLLLALQVTAGDTAYASAALRTLVAEVAVANKALPSSLSAYRARAESEIALLLRSASEQENVMQLEQIESDLQWQRSGRVDQRVIGYRTRTFSLTVSAMTYLRRPWVVPVLYGNRLRLLLADRDPREPLDRSPLLAIHPLADDRDRVYRFDGGDTVVVLQLAHRRIPVIRIQVTPVAVPPGRTLLFRGDIDIDAVRKQVIRMRGEFLVRRSHAPIWSRALSVGLQPLAFAELINAEVEERYWLPSYQRIEVQLRSPLSTEFRPVFRVITRFRDYTLNALASFSGAAVQVADSGSPAVERLSLAPSDSISRFSEWVAEIGAATAGVQASDFDDVTPDQWSPRGGPRLDWHAERFSDVLRSNRVEGVYTGISARVRMRDAAPGLSMGGYGGYTWTEETLRGALSAQWIRAPWRSSLRVERSLASTNDFVPPLEDQASMLAVVFTNDDYDYVDRRSATLSLAREVGGERGARVRLELSSASDRSEISRLQYGLIHGAAGFRPNRPAASGRYFRTLVGFDFHPNVSGEYLEPGVGAGLSYERGDGELRWQRIEARLVGRHTWGPIIYGARMDGAMVLGRQPPPQQLIEFGENEGLPGYGYKEFGGDRAALIRFSAAYQLPYLRSPLRLHRLIYLPSIAPSISFGVQSGWAAASPTTRAVLASFGPLMSLDTGQPVLDPATGLPFPATRPSGGVRSTISLTMRLFGGAVGIGMARPVDHAAPWVLVLALDQQW